MNNRNNYIDKLNAFNDEILQLQEFYNLHPIEIINLFNDTLKEIYLNESNKDEYLIYRDKYQLFFYHIPTKTIKVKNISLSKYKQLRNILQQEIYKKSLDNETLILVSNIASKQFIKCKKYKSSNKYIYLKPDKTNMNIQKNIIFRYEIDYLDNIEFINNLNETWILVEHKKLKKKILHTKQNTIVISIDIFHIKVVMQLVKSLLKKIAIKTKFNMRIRARNRQAKIISLVNTTYLPLSLIKFIQAYVYHYTTYTVFFENTDA